MTVRVRPAGDRALLVLPDDPGRAVDIAVRLRAHELAADVVAGAETVLVRLMPHADAASAAWALGAAAEEASTSAGPSRPAGPEIVIPVCYDGPDLIELAGVLGCDSDDVVAAHTRAVWRCAFVGFAPGFAYLESVDWPFEVPRLATPRTRVPPGSVAVAARYAAVYPRETPGGWRLIGSTTMPMFDLARRPPAVVTAGTQVRFVAT